MRWPNALCDLTLVIDNKVAMMYDYPFTDRKPCSRLHRVGLALDLLQHSPQLPLNGQAVQNEVHWWVLRRAEAPREHTRSRRKTEDMEASLTARAGVGERAVPGYTHLHAPHLSSCFLNHPLYL